MDALHVLPVTALPSLAWARGRRAASDGRDGMDSAQCGEVKLERSQTAENTREKQGWRNGRGQREEPKDNYRQGVLSCLPEQK